jgi:ADP-ribosylglycohydrolase
MPTITVNATRHPDLESGIHDVFNAMSVVSLCADHLTLDSDSVGRLLSAIFNAAEKVDALRDAWREGIYGAERAA